MSHCWNCGRPAFEACCCCGNALCPMCFETGGGFCTDPDCWTDERGEAMERAMEEN
jgi:hypothetical protein